MGESDGLEVEHKHMNAQHNVSADVENRPKAKDNTIRWEKEGKPFEKPEAEGKVFEKREEKCTKREGFGQRGKDDLPEYSAFLESEIKFEAQEDTQTEEEVEYRIGEGIRAQEKGQAASKAMPATVGSAMAGIATAPTGSASTAMAATATM